MSLIFFDFDFEISNVQLTNVFLLFVVVVMTSQETSRIFFDFGFDFDFDLEIPNVRLTDFFLLFVVAVILTTNQETSRIFFDFVFDFDLEISKVRLTNACRLSTASLSSSTCLRITSLL